MTWKIVVVALALLATVVATLFLAGRLDAQARASIIVEWTATGDDASSGTVAANDLRWATSRPDTTSSTAKAAWWAAANVVSPMPTPLVAGSAQSVTVSPVGGFPEGATYYFVLQSRDDANNWSGWSNVAWITITDTTPPAPILNLRVR